MSRLVVINLGEGNLRSGYPNVTVQIATENESPSGQFRGGLPADPKLEQLYKNWQLLYREFYREQNSRSVRGIEIESGGVTQFSSVEFRHLGQQLEAQLNVWLNSESFRAIDCQLSRILAPTEEIRLMIETNNELIRRLPWHLWNFLADYPQAEIALSTLEYRRIKLQSRTPRGRVRILAILGNSNRLDLLADRQRLETLSNATIQILESPQYQELNEHLWHPLGWDILFFAGHSQTEETGRIYLNQTDAITLEQLKNALKRAIARGLQLAIFNSCDGLGLAQSLAELHIPQVIVMRELVPDEIATEFFQDFLTAFSGGQSLYIAVREAREKLEKLEDKYPYATWLPVIYQNPATIPVTWQELSDSLTGDRQYFSLKQRLFTLLLGSIMVTSLIIGIRQIGVFQQWELEAFDRLMQLRPQEKPDPRLLLITITEKDVQNQNAQERRSSSLSDRALAKLLTKIQLYNPRAIGLDIYRDFSLSSKYRDFKTYLQDNKSFVGVCEVGQIADDSGIRPPPELPGDRLSFSNIPIDADGLIRRQLLGMAIAPTSFCQTDTSFSFRLAQLYLAQQGIKSQRTPKGNLQIGDVIFRKLQPDTGSYHQLDNSGFQILLNYRSSEEVAEQITLGEFLNDTIDHKLTELIKDRIVLIGTVAPSFKDYFPTPPINSKWSKKMPGVIIQAHMTSQILSAVLDKRPLIWWLPAWGETIWIWSWSLVGGGLGLYFRSLPGWGLANGVAIGTLYGVSLLLFVAGAWIPLVPTAIALITTGGSIFIYRVRKM